MTNTINMTYTVIEDCYKIRIELSIKQTISRSIQNCPSPNTTATSFHDSTTTIIIPTEHRGYLKP